MEKQLKLFFEFLENDYKTPPELYKRALDWFSLYDFTIDVCCTDKNIPADHYFVNGIK